MQITFSIYIILVVYNILVFLKFYVRVHIEILRVIPSLNPIFSFWLSAGT